MGGREVSGIFAGIFMVIYFIFAEDEMKNALLIGFSSIGLFVIVVDYFDNGYYSIEFILLVAAIFGYYLLRNYLIRRKLKNSENKTPK